MKHLEPVLELIFNKCCQSIKGVIIQDCPCMTTLAVTRSKQRSFGSHCKLILPYLIGPSLKGLKELTISNTKIEYSEEIISVLKYQEDLEKLSWNSWNY